MSYAVAKAAGYVLVHTPDMVFYNGTTQTTEMVVNPDSEYLKKVPESLRSYEDVVAYPPNQVYIGSLKPEELNNYEAPWYDKKVEGATRKGKLGEIMPQDEFIGLMKICDAFDLVSLSKEFTAEVKEKLGDNPLIAEELIASLKDGEEIDAINKLIEEQGAEAIFNDDKVVGCVKRAHAVDVNLSAHVMFENIVCKASGVVAFLQLLDKNDIDPAIVDYVIECSEEACGDMNQRGGGNFAKSIAEIAGAVNASGSDTRGFCAAPVHALVEASALVHSGTFDHVVVVAGGSTAKLGMNGKDHVRQDIPILEDVVAGFALLIGKNDGVSPILRTDLVGTHTVGTGSSPQAVITSLVTDPLDRGGLKITDVDKFSAEMQNPDITKPAGAGDVPEANYKMIAALGVKRGDLERADVATFAGNYGMPGWAPTQGHIPSGVPYMGYAIQDFKDKKIKRAMIIGKGSLFLGRMTNLFDGISIILEENTGPTEPTPEISEEEIKSMIAEAMRGFASHLLEE